MRKLLLAILLLGTPALGFAAGGEGASLMKAHTNPSDVDSLQRGAKLFVNYCVGCHSAEYMRFSRVAQDLNLPEDLVEQYLIFTGGMIGDTMESAMDPEDGERWFGVVPPDLTLVARRRSADWVYTYLNSFYRDDSRPVGVNNVVFPDVGMPHVLWQLQGMPEPKLEDADADGSKQHVVGVQVPEGAGTMTPREYQQATRDLTNFMAYMAEPVKAYRQELGVKVILFLLVFLAVAWLLKKEYWKDVH